MPGRDLLFRFPEGSFSYRVAGVCVHKGCVLLQRPDGDDGYALPGGQVAFGETHEQTLVRELKEETGLDVRVGRLLGLGEVFFPWKGLCQQINPIYELILLDPQAECANAPQFTGVEQDEGGRFKLGFYWVPLERLGSLKVYPPQAAALATQGPECLHFVYREPNE